MNLKDISIELLKVRIEELISEMPLTSYKMKKLSEIELELYKRNVILQDENNIEVDTFVYNKILKIKELLAEKCDINVGEHEDIEDLFDDIIIITEAKDKALKYYYELIKCSNS